MRSCRALVIGGGIMGLSAALHLAKGGLETFVVRLSDQGAPRNETGRNQGWLQCGIRQVRRSADGSLNTSLAERMRQSGLGLFDALALAPPAPAGVQYVPSGRVADVKRDAKALGVPVRVMTVPQARKALGVLYDRPIERTFIKTPEAPFKVPLVMTMLRHLVTQHRHTGAVHIIDDPAQIYRDDSQPSGVRVMIGERHVPASIVVLASGAGTIPILRRLEVVPAEDPLPVFLEQTPLLRYERNLLGTAGVLHDRVRQFSAVVHPRGGDQPVDATVVGLPGFTRAVDFEDPYRRRIDRDQEIAMLQKAEAISPELIKDALITAGLEVVVRDPSAWGMLDERDDYLVASLDRYALPNVILSLPGRATLAWYAATRVAELALTRTGDSAVASFEAPGRPWTEPYRSHIHPDYRSMHDVDQDLAHRSF